MIELALVFGLGMLTAGLVWLMLLPAFWRRAVRLTRARLEKSLPVSANEILAEQDRLRAEHAVAEARLRDHAERAQAALVAAKAETGERLKAEAALHETIVAERARIVALEAEIGEAKGRIEAHEASIESLIEARDLAHATIAGLEAQRDALEARLLATTDIAENRRLLLDEARVLAERAKEAEAEEAHRSTHLRQQLQARQAELREAERRIEDFERNAAGQTFGAVQAAADMPERQRQAG